MSEWQAFIIGAVIVVVFSYERFNQATYERQRLKRLVDLVSPDKMRARRYVVQAWFAYAAGLIVIYALMCTYSEIFMQIGFVLPDGGDVDTGKDKEASGIPSSVSLTSALILVGLAPSTPGLKRFETWLRETAHTIVGIPTRVLSISDKIRRNSKCLPKGAGEKNALLPDVYAKRISHYSIGAKGHLIAQDDFENDLNLIFAISHWILDRNLELAEDATRQRFEKLEENLSSRRERLVQDLDDRTGFNNLARPSGNARSTTRSKGVVVQNDFSQLSWEKLARDVREFADDLSIMLALFVENEIVPRDGWKSKAQDKDAKENLEFYLKTPNSESGTDVPSYTLFALLWSVCTIIGISLAWSFFPGYYESELRWNGEPSTFYGRVAFYSGTAINYLVIPILISLSIRDAARRKYRKNLCATHWTRALPQVLVIVLVSSACTLIAILAFTFWHIGVTDGLNEVDSWKIIREVLDYNAFYLLRGSVLALILVYLLDWHEKEIAVARQKGIEFLEHQPTPRASLRWGIMAAAIMAASGGLARIMASVVGAQRNGRSELDEIDRGLIFYGAVFSAIVGFLVVFMLSEALRNKRQAEETKSRSNSSNQASARQERQASLVIFGLALLVMGFANRAYAQDDVVIAVRKDTPPFAYIDPGTGAATGFFYRICIEAVTRAGYQFTEKPINIDERNKFLKTGSGDFDLLCDPTTITLGRMRNFSNDGEAPMLEFSQIVFVANRTYATYEGDFSKSFRTRIEETQVPPADVNCTVLLEEEAGRLRGGVEPPKKNVQNGNQNETEKNNLIERLRNMFSFRGDKKIIQFRDKKPDESDDLEQKDTETWGYVSGTTMDWELNGEGQNTDSSSILCPFTSHKKAALAFCRGQLSRYYGDADIIRAAISEYGQAADSGCEVKLWGPDDERTYEPYAFVLSSRHDPDHDFPERFSCALYSMFQDGAVRDLAKGSFPKPTETLNTLFAINKIGIGEPSQTDGQTGCGIKRPLTEISQ